MDIPQVHKIFQQHPVVCTDSRHVSEDAIFFALKGNTYDGHAFAAEALDKGCAFAVIDQPAYNTSQRYLLVDDVLTTLQGLAAYHRSLYRIPVLAITGSNGKTTTKELCHRILAQKYRCIATQGNLNNHIGVPLTLLTLGNEVDVAVVEMGANHPGEIGRLCQIARPGLGIITNIGRAHLEGFGGFEGVVQAKRELYDFIYDMNGMLFVNADDERLMTLSQSMNRITYSLNEPAEIRGRFLSMDPFVCMGISFPGKGELTAHSRLTGKYNMENMLAAAAVGHFFGVDPDAIVRAIEDYNPENMRSQVKDTERNCLILDAYNANPSSMESALVDFSQLTEPRKFLILGDMYELGAESIAEHQGILELIRRLGFGQGILVGDCFSAIPAPDGFLSFMSVRDARLHLEQHPVENSLVLIKGSRAVGLEKIIDLL